MTAFIHTRVELAPGLDIVVDGNSKITAGNGTYAKPQPNAFSLPAASVSGANHCPGSTPTCRASCYVRGLAKHAPEVYAAYEQNAETLAKIFASAGAQWHASARALGFWIADHCIGGFRWHVSGDVLHEDHARWIATVCAHSQNVRHWTYTRTLEAVRELVRVPNLTVNVSADRDNWDVARAVALRYGARIAYMATPHEWRDGESSGERICAACGVMDHSALPDPPGPCVPADLPDGSVVFPDYPLRGRELADPTEHSYWREAPKRLRVMTCPADFFGQSEAHRCGPCDKCITPTRGAR